MEIQPTILDYVQICMGCENKLYKDEFALKVSDGIYFCNTDCLIRNVEILNE